MNSTPMTPRVPAAVWRPAARRARLAVAACVLLAGAHAAGMQPAAAEPSSAGRAVKDIRDMLDAADKLREDGKPGKAAAGVAAAARAIEDVSRQGPLPTGLRAQWERCRSLRNELELEGADVSGIVLAPLKQSASKAASARGPAAGDPAMATPAATKPAAPQPAAKPALTFTGQVAPILSRHCGGCHIAGRKGGFQMTSYAGLMKTGMVQPGAGEASRLVEVILSGDMPRGGGKVSPEDVGVLRRWIDSGAPFDGPDPMAPLDAMARQSTAAAAAPPAAPVAAVKLKPGEVSFAADVAPVFVANCVGCHDAAQPESNFSMVTLERLLRGGRGGVPVVAGKGADSLLVKKLKGAGIEGQRMPLGKQPLPDDVIATIQKWIDQGARLDMLTAKSELETVAAAGRSQKLPHADLRKVRFAAGTALWSRAIPDEQPTVEERGDVMVIGNLSATRMAELADAAASAEQRVRAELGGGDAPLLKGGVVAFVFAKGYDLSSFWETVLSDERPKGMTATAGVLGDVVYVALVPPGDGDTGGGRDGAGGDARALLAEQLTAAAFIGRGSPAWFARGAGRALAMRLEPKSDLVAGWRRDLPAALARSGSAKDFLAGHGDRLAAIAVGGGFVGAMLSNTGRLEMLAKALDAGGSFDQAFAAVFHGQPQPLFEAWAAQSGRQSARSPRR